MRVLVTGAAGFTGSYVVPMLLDRGVAVRCFVRPSSDTRPLPVGQVEIVHGDLDKPASFQTALSGVDALVNLASLGFGHADGIVAAAVKAGVRRALFMSTTAIFTHLDAASKSVRLSAEETIRNSGLRYTVLRPTMIYGGSRDRNVWRLIRYLRRWPAVPVIGKGLQQPVYVGDVADAVTRALLERGTVGRFYNIPGKSALTLDQMIDEICLAMKRRVRKVHLPGPPVAACVAFAERFSIRLPVSSEQILRLSEDKSFDYSQAREDFGYQPRSFSEGIALETAQFAL
jgi:uncharacterized protein YbjT (DUF2867 family)